MQRSKHVLLRAIGLASLLLISFILIGSISPSRAKAASLVSSNWYNAASYVMPLANNFPN